MSGEAPRIDLSKPLIPSGNEKQSFGEPAHLEGAGGIDGGYVEFTGTGAEQEIQHGLGRTPVGYWKVGASPSDGSVWDLGASRRTWNDQAIYLAGTSGVTFKVLLV